MKCPVCGREVNSRAFCAHCGAYLPDVSQEDMSLSLLKVSAFKIKRSVSFEEYLASFKIGFSFSIILLAFFTLLFALTIYHMLNAGISINELVLLSVPLSFWVAAIVGLMRYFPLVRFLPSAMTGDFVAIRCIDSFDVDCFYHGRVYRCTLANRYTLSRKGKGVQVYREGKPCALDLASLKAYFEDESARL